MVWGVGVASVYARNTEPKNPAWLLWNVHPLNIVPLPPPENAPPCRAQPFVKRESSTLSTPSLWMDAPCHIALLLSKTQFVTWAAAVAVTSIPPPVCPSHASNLQPVTTRAQPETRMHPPRFTVSAPPNCPRYKFRFTSVTVSAAEASIVKIRAACAPSRMTVPAVAARIVKLRVMLTPVLIEYVPAPRVMSVTDKSASAVSRAAMESTIV